MPFVDLRPDRLIPIEQPVFPDYRENYIKTVVQPQAAEEARRAAEQAEADRLAQLAAQPAYEPPAAPPAPTPSFGSCGDWLANAGVTDIKSAMGLIGRESGCNPYAVNPSSGACGVAQELPCGKSGCALGNGACQVAWMSRYVVAVYGSWASALEHSLRNSWY